MTLVVAQARNGVIGRDGGLPWRIPADMRHFKQVTMGTVMVMGRRTFDSLPRLLPGRRHVVLTRDRSWRAAGADVAHSVEEAIGLAGDEKISVIGGADIFALFLPLATEVELTEVHAEAEGDTVMPPLDPSHWREVSRERHGRDDGGLPFDFVRLVRAAG